MSWKVWNDPWPQIVISEFVVEAAGTIFENTQNQETKKKEKAANQMNLQIIFQFKVALRRNKMWQQNMNWRKQFGQV